MSVIVNVAPPVVAPPVDDDDDDDDDDEEDEEVEGLLPSFCRLQWMIACFRLTESPVATTSLSNVARPRRTAPSSHPATPFPFPPPFPSATAPFVAPSVAPWATGTMGVVPLDAPPLDDPLDPPERNWIPISNGNDDTPLPPPLLPCIPFIPLMPLVPSVLLALSSHVDPSDPGAARPMRRVRHGVCLPGARGRGGSGCRMEEELEEDEEDEEEEEEDEEEEEEDEDAEEGRWPPLRGVMVIE